MNWLSKIKYFIVAAIILIIGYFLGTIILGIIFGIIILMTIFFIISLIFNKSLDRIFSKKGIRFFKTILFGFISGLMSSFIYKLFDFTSFSEIKIIIFLWVINAIIFGTLWNMFNVNQRISYKDNVLTVNQKDYLLNFKDILFMLIIPIIISITISIVNGII